MSSKKRKHRRSKKKKNLIQPEIKNFNISFQELATQNHIQSTKTTKKNEVKKSSPDNLNATIKINKDEKTNLPKKEANNHQPTKNIEQKITSPVSPKNKKANLNQNIKNSPESKLKQKSIPTKEIKTTNHENNNKITLKEQTNKKSSHSNIFVSSLKPYSNKQLISILLLLFIVLGLLFGLIYYQLKYYYLIQTNNEITQEINQTKEKINNIEQENVEISNSITELEKELQNKIEEYNIWLKTKEKIEKALS